jgi:uncharacterized membrane-anchored protein
MWNIITIVICTLALIFNFYLWYDYKNKIVRETREKEGWNKYYLVSTLLILIVLLRRIGKL